MKNFWLKNVSKITKIGLGAVLALAVATAGQNVMAAADFDITATGGMSATDGDAGVGVGDISNNDTLEFDGTANHTFTISGDPQDAGGDAVDELGNITTDTTTIANGGTLVFNLAGAGNTFTTGDIGTMNNWLNTVDVTTGTITTGNIFAGGVVIGDDGTLKAGNLTIDTLNGSGDLTYTGAMTVSKGGVFSGDVTGGDIILNATEVLLLSGTNEFDDATITKGTLNLVGTGKVDNDLTVDAGGLLVLNGTLGTNAYTVGNEASFGANSTVAIYGDAADGTVLADLGATAPGTPNLVNYSQFTGWEIFDDTAGSGNYQLLGVRLSQANMSDVRLSALMLHNRQAIWTATSDRITQNFRYWNDRAARGACGTGCGDMGHGNGAGCATGCGNGFNKLSGNSVWVNYVGRKNKLASSYQFTNDDYDITSNGVQAGFDIFSNRCTQFGVLFGYEKEKSELRRNEVEADDYYFGLYAARAFGRGWDVRGFLGYGHQSYDMTRYGADQGALGFINRHNSSFDGDTFEATVELGRRFCWNRCLSFRPVVAIDFYNNHIDGANENGNQVTAANYGDSSLTQTFLRFGSDVQWDKGRWNLNGGAYYSYQIADNGDTLRTWTGSQQAGVDGSWLYGTDLGNSVVTLSAGTQYYLNSARTFAVFANYFGDVYTDRDSTPWQHTGLIGAQYRF